MFQFNGGAHIPFVLPFECHPGPINDALTDAKNLHRSLFLFIYCKENPNTKNVISLLRLDNVAQAIHNSFIFYPQDVTWPEGWAIATQLKFQELPLIALIRPRGHSLEESNVFVQHEGKLGANALLSFINVEHQNAEANEAHGIVQQQNDEFNNAVLQDEINLQQEEEQRRAEEEASRLEQEAKVKVEAEFESLPTPPPNADCCTIKFQFPDSTSQHFKFERNSPIHFIFIFVRKHMFPSNFNLFTGFPRQLITDSDEPISSRYTDKNFIVFVEED